MNTRLSLSVILATSLFFISCKKELVPQDSASAVAETTNAKPGQAPQNTINPVNQTGQADASVPQRVASPVAATPAGMNPPHGQPNHRCDIAVGAPLNSPPGKKTPATGQPQMVAGKSMAVQPQVPVKTAPGMNPPHGQPNHRCDIAVGAPLNSPVAGKTPAPGATLIQRNPDGSEGASAPAEIIPQPVQTKP